MADNITITPGTGATIAADEIDSALYQRIKLVSGTSSATDLAFGQTTKSGSLPVTLATDHFGQAVSASSIPVVIASDYRLATVVSGAFTATASGTSHVTGDVVGTSVTFTDCGRDSECSGIILGALCTSNLNPATKPSLELWLFTTIGATTFTNDSLFDPTDTNIGNLVGIIPFNIWYSGGASVGQSNSASNAMMLSPIVFKTAAASGGDLTGVLVLRSSTFVCAGEVYTVKLFIQQS